MDASGHPQTPSSASESPVIPMKSSTLPRSSRKASTALSLVPDPIDAQPAAAVDSASGAWTKCGDSQGVPLLGIAKDNFDQDQPHRLQLDLGETVIILRENVNWYYGYVKKNKSQRGIFPKTYVHIFPAEGPNGDELSIRRDDFVKEISNVLNDWRTLFNEFYLTGNCAFKQLNNKILELIQLRSKLLTGNLPVDEMRVVKLQATDVIDTGNSLLGLDMLVRDELGNVLDIGRTSTTHLYEQHVNAQNRIRKANSSNRNRHSQTLNKYGHSLSVSVHALVCKHQDLYDMLFTLYDGDTMRAISENFCVKWDVQFRPLHPDRCDVLFTDLSGEDLKRKLFLVCHVVRWGGMEAKDSSMKRISTLNRKSNQATTVPQSSSAMSLGDGSDSRSVGSGSGVQAHSGPAPMRRPFAVAYYDLTELLKHPEADGGQFPVELRIPLMPCEKESFDSTLRKLIATRDKNSFDSNIPISVCLISEEKKQMKPMHSVLARKMGFPEVILPGEVRNDLYLTLSTGEFARGSNFSDKNVEVTVTVCNDSGAIVPNVLSFGAGAGSIDEYRSVIYYHEDRPKWNETLRIQISIEEFKRCHLRFTFKHRCTNKDRDKNEKPFGFAYVRLMQANGTALQNQQHPLVVYKIDHKKSSKDDDGLLTMATYMQLPSLMNELADNPKPSLGVLSMAGKDAFTIETKMCSTKLTQDVNLLGLLNWSADRTTILSSLIALTKVSPEEIVKFLQDILDALFDILRDNDTDGSINEIDLRVFECLLRLIETVDDKKYQHFQSVLDLYINDSFSATLAYVKLIRVLQRHIMDHLGQTNHSERPDEELYRTVRHLQYFIKFIIRSRILHADLEGDRDRGEFEAMLQGMLNTFVSLTSSEKDLLRSQGAVLKFLHVITTDLLQVYRPLKLCDFIVDVIQRFPAGRLAQSKRQCIADLVNSKLFTMGECRAILLPVFCQQIKEKLDNNDEGDTDLRQQEKNLSKAAKILGENTSLLHTRESTTKTKISDCLKILNSILDLLFNGARQEDPVFGAIFDDVTVIMNVLLRTIIRMSSTMNPTNPLIQNMVAVMLSILRSMNHAHYQLYVRQLSRLELQQLLIEILSAFDNLVSTPVYPAEWMDMIMHQNTVMLESLRQLTYVIMDQFFSPFEKSVWSTFFHCSIAFLTQPSLQLNRFVASKKTAILQRYEDMRRRTTDEIRHMWDKLGEHKPSFVPELVGPILEMSLLPDEELRRATIPIFFDMMQCEWFSSRLLPGSYGDTKRCTAHCKGSFDDFEKEMIRKLDTLVESGHGDAEYHRLFEEVMLGLCAGHTVLRERGERFVSMVSGLLGRLLEYRSIMQDESKENRMSCTVSLLEYYKTIVCRNEMYIRYVDKLCALHEEFENYVEAAFALELHNCLLTWTDEPLTTLLRARRWPECQTHRQLKEKLCLKIVDLFRRGEMYECAIVVCRQLAQQYEQYDYRLLSDTHERLAQFYRMIIDKQQTRYDCVYYRVAYYGLGFPEFLRNRVFVYRGKALEKLPDFCARLLAQQPGAELLQTMQAGDEIKQADGRNILINSVEPLSDSPMVSQFEERNGQIAWYYRTNNVRRFRFSRVYRTSDGAAHSGDIGHQWLERTELLTKSALPGILKWSEVSETRVTHISPLQSAIETMELTNKDFRMLCLMHSNDPMLDINPLSMKINGVIHANVNGGLAKYEEAFMTAAYLERNPHDSELIELLKARIAEQIPLLELALRLHRMKAKPELAAMQEQLECCFAQMQINVETKYGKRTVDLPIDSDLMFVTMRRPGSALPSGLADAPNRHSETSMGSSDSSGFVKAPYGTRSTFKAFPFNANLTSPKPKKDKPQNKRRSSKKIDRDSSSMSLATTWYLHGSTPSTPTASTGDTHSLTDCAPSTPAASHPTDFGPNNALNTPGSGAASLPVTPSNVVELTEMLTPQRPLRSEVEREKRLSRPTSTLTPTPTPTCPDGKGRAADSQSLSGDSSSNRNSTVTTCSTTSEDDAALPPPLPAKMRESSDYSSTNMDSLLATGHHHSAVYEASPRVSLGRTQSLSIGSGRYTNRPLPAVPIGADGGCNSNSSSSTTITSLSIGGASTMAHHSYNASYDLVLGFEGDSNAGPEAFGSAQLRPKPPTPPPKPSRGVKAPPVNG